MSKDNLLKNIALVAPYYNNSSLLAIQPPTIKQNVYKILHSIAFGSPTWAAKFLGHASNAKIRSWWKKIGLKSKNPSTTMSMPDYASLVQESQSLNVSPYIEITDPADDEDVKETIHPEQVSLIKRQNHVLRSKLSSANDRIADLENAWQQLTDNVLSQVAAWKPVKYPSPPKTSKYREHIALMDISDIHIGEHVKASDTMGLSEYGWNIFLQRKEGYMNGLTRIVEDLKPQHPFRIGIIHALGDWITGEDTFPLQMSRLDKFIQEQVIDGMQHMADLVRYICTLFPKVILYGLPGNHTAGRGTTMNIDLLSYAFLKALLKDQENLTIHVSESSFLGYELSNKYVPIDFPEEYCWKYALSHGDAAKIYYSRPYYSLDRIVSKISRTTGHLFHHTFMAHAHEFAETLDWSVNGSWVGGTEYSLKKMQSVAAPHQNFYTWHPHFGLGYRLPIYLDEIQLQSPTDKDGIIGITT